MPHPTIVPTAGYTTTAPADIFGPSKAAAASHTDDGMAGISSLSPIENPRRPTVLTEVSINQTSNVECGTDGCTDEDGETSLSFFRLTREPYTCYRSWQSHLSWIPGSGERFGLVEWHSDPYLKRNESSGFTGDFNITWLSGPGSTPLPSRVYELSAGYQMREQWSPLFSYDLSARIGIFSDFEGSAREGVRFPAHAVGMLHLSHSTDLVFGADFLDRDDISILPVFGFSIRSDQCPDLRMDLVFPRPRIDFNLSDSRRMYLTGLLGGDTWDVDDGVDLVATSRDYRLMLGFERANGDRETSSIEFGYVWGRQLEVRGQPGHTAFEDAFIIRCVTRR